MPAADALPSLNATALKDLNKIYQAVLADPSLVEGDHFNIPDWVRNALRREVAGLKFMAVEDESDAEGDEDTIRDWIGNLLEDLETMRGAGINSMEPAQQNTYFRLAGAMTEKLLSQKERMYNMALAREFMTNVVALLEELVPEDIAAELMMRVESDLERRRGAK